MGLDTTTMDIIQTDTKVHCASGKQACPAHPTSMEVTWVSEVDEKTLYFPTELVPARYSGMRPQGVGAFPARLEAYWFREHNQIPEFVFHPMLDGKPIVAPTTRDMHNISRYFAHFAYNIGTKYTRNCNPRGAASIPIWNLDKNTDHVLTKVVAVPGGSRLVKSHWE